MNFDGQQHLTELDDDELAQKAEECRARAMGGDKAAFGLADAFEAELRRRSRDSALQPLTQIDLPPVKPWWKFW